MAIQNNNTYFKQAKTLKALAIETPLGLMTAIADEEALYLLEFRDSKGIESAIIHLEKQLKANITDGKTVILNLIQQELKAYFNGQLKHFVTPTHCIGSSFQQTVWQTLRAIPYGETRSYTEQAKLVGNPLACRAVANANAANLIAILIPCHRIINLNGKLGGYAGGIKRKQWLLDHEKGSNLKNPISAL